MLSSLSVHDLSVFFITKFKILFIILKALWSSSICGSMNYSPFVNMRAGLNLRRGWESAELFQRKHHCTNNAIIYTQVYLKAFVKPSFTHLHLFSIISPCVFYVSYVRAETLASLVSIAATTFHKLWRQNNTSGVIETVSQISILSTMECRKHLKWLKLRHFTILWKILAHFEFYSNMSQKKAREGWSL